MMNSSIASENPDEYQFFRVEQLTFLFLLFILIVTANFGVIYFIFVHQNRKSRMNFFFLNLAFVDILVGFTNVLVDIVWKFTVYWYAGNLMCKLIRYLQTVVIYASTYVLVAMSFDRYMAVCQPMHYLRKEKRNMMIIVVWALSFTFSIPSLIFNSASRLTLSPNPSGSVNSLHHLNGTTLPPSLNLQPLQQCWISLPYDWMWRPYFTTIMALIYVAPAVVMIVAYGIIVSTIWKRARNFTTNPRDPSIGPVGRLRREKSSTMARGDSLFRSFMSSRSAGSKRGLSACGRTGISCTGIRDSTTSSYYASWRLRRKGLSPGYVWTPMRPSGQTHKGCLVYNNNIYEKDPIKIGKEAESSKIHNKDGVPLPLINCETIRKRSRLGSDVLLQRLGVNRPREKSITHFEKVVLQQYPSTMVKRATGSGDSSLEDSKILAPKQFRITKLPNRRLTFMSKSSGRGDSFMTMSRQSTMDNKIRPCVMVNSYGIIPKAKIKSIKITFAIVIVFIVCWSPYFIFDFLDVYNLLTDNPKKRAITVFIQSLSPLNSAANPLIYFGFNTKWWLTLKKYYYRLVNRTSLKKKIKVRSSISSFAPSSLKRAK